MSERRDIVVIMTDAMRAHEAEMHARLMGVVAALALPEVRCLDGSYRTRVVEIELARESNVWQPVHGVSISAEAITFFTNESDGAARSSWRFTHAEGCPAWRMDHGRARHGGGM